MATKKLNLSELVDKSMAGRELNALHMPADTPVVHTEQDGLSIAAPRFKPRPKQAVMLRLDAGDYAQLQRIAEKQGTKASALIRKAVKELLAKN